MINGEVVPRLIISKKLKKRKNNNLEAVHPEAIQNPVEYQQWRFFCEKFYRRYSTGF